MIGANSLNYGASTGTSPSAALHRQRARRPDARLPADTSDGVPLSAQLDGYVNYYSGYVQDDWRVTTA